MFLKKTILFVFILCSFKGYALSNEHVILELPDQNKQNYRSVHSKMPKKDTVGIVERVKSNIEKFVHKHYRVVILGSMGLVGIAGSAFILSKIYECGKKVYPQLDEHHRSYEASCRFYEAERELIAEQNRVLKEECGLMNKKIDQQWNDVYDFLNRKERLTSKALGLGYIPIFPGRPHSLKAAHLKEDRTLRKSKKARLN